MYRCHSGLNAHLYSEHGLDERLPGRHAHGGRRPVEGFALAEVHCEQLWKGGAYHGIHSAEMLLTHRGKYLATVFKINNSLNILKYYSRDSTIIIEIMC